MKLIAVFALFVIFAITAGAVVAEDRRAMYGSQAEIAQAQTDGIIAQAQSQSEIANYEASVDIAAITAQLEIARLEMETTRLANLIESEKIQAAIAQTNALLTQSAVDLERVRAERERMWIMLAIPAALVIVAIFAVMVVLIVILRRPIAPSYHMITMSREITARPPDVTGIVLSTRVQKRQGVDYYEVRNER